MVGVSCWFLLKKRNRELALASIKVASITGLAATLVVMGTGDQSGITIAREQPMKLAAAEGLRQGGPQAPFSIVPGIEVPGVLSILATHDVNGYVPGIDNLLEGYTTPDGTTHLSAEEKMARGRKAIAAFSDFRQHRLTNPAAAAEARAEMEANIDYFGYGYIQKAEDLVPPVWLVYWSFRLMVGLGSFLMLFLILAWWMQRKGTLENARWMHLLGLAAIPMVYMAGQAGWIVAEVGRQPWIVYNLMRTSDAVSPVPADNVMFSLIAFIVVYSVLGLLDIFLLRKYACKGPEGMEA